MKRITIVLISLCGLSFTTLIFSNWYVGVNSQITLPYASGTHSDLTYTNRKAPFNKVGTFDVNGEDIGTSLGIVAGYAMQRPSKWFSETRLSLQGSHTLLAPSIKGRWNYTLFSPAATYDYRYDVETSLLGVNVETDIYQWGSIAPFIGAGMGIDWLKSEHFSTAPVNNASTVSYRFVGSRNRNIYYQGELGMRYRSHQYAVSLAYVYQYLGKVNSGQGETAVGAIAPAIEDKLQQHSLQLQINYYF